MGLWQEEVEDAITQTPASSKGQTTPSSVIFDASLSCSPTVVPEAPSKICTRWRDMIVEWKYQVLDRFDLNRDLVCISTFYMDRYLSMNYVDEERFQLVAMASIYLATKIHSPKKVTPYMIESMGNGLITSEHIVSIELSIMKCLDWHLHPPTPVAYIENFFPLIISRCRKIDGMATSDLSEFSRFLAELSVCAYSFAFVEPSTVALAAISYSLEYFGMPEEARDALRAVANETCLLDMDAPEVEACGKLLRRMYVHAMPGDDFSWTL